MLCVCLSEISLKSIISAPPKFLVSISEKQIHRAQQIRHIPFLSKVRLISNVSNLISCFQRHRSDLWLYVDLANFVNFNVASRICDRLWAKFLMNPFWRWAGTNVSRNRIRNKWAIALYTFLHEHKELLSHAGQLTFNIMHRTKF